MGLPADRRYAQTHEWFKVEGDIVTIGITQFAADELTDITYVELPRVGAQLASGQAVGEIESVKATADLLSALSGEVVEVNQRLSDSPELLNNDPMNEGWIVKARCADLSPLDKLMDAAAYEKMISH